jgi:sugar lactone lactonase YvrE
VEGNTLKNKRVYLDCGNGTADGIACDADGNLWCGWGSGNEELDGVRIFNPQGKHIGTIQLPSAARTCALAANSAIGCLWRPARQSIRCTSMRRALS